MGRPPSDVIQPSSRVRDDSQFYESYADRRAARLEAARVDRSEAAAAEARRRSSGVPWNKGREAPKPLASGAVVDDEFRRRFERMWRSGVTMKRVQLELGASRTTLMRLKVKMGLPNRRTGPSACSVLKVMLTAEEAEALDLRCHQASRTKSSYVKGLVRRDLGL